MSKLELDKYYTNSQLAKYCVEKTFEILGKEWERIIEPSCGIGSFLSYLPESTLSYDIDKNSVAKEIIDYREVKLPFIENSLVIGNPPFGRANRLSAQFVRVSLEHSGYISFIQPISQLDNNRLMNHTDLIYSEDLGELEYSGAPIRCCLNMYHRNMEATKQKFEIPGLIYCGHLFRSGKCKHSDERLNANYDFRIAAWHYPRLLKDGETCTNEIVINVRPDRYKWFKEKLEQCNFDSLKSCTNAPNMPDWRVLKYLQECYDKDYPRKSLWL